MSRQRSSLTPNVAVLCSTLLWGTLWIPLRETGETGVGGSSATAVSFLLPLALMLPFAVTIVPLYEIFVRAGEFTERIGMFKIGHDTLWPLFIRAFFGNAFLIFLMRQFFMTIPIELEEAARIDGASRAQTLFYVLIPLIIAAITVLNTIRGSVYERKEEIFVYNAVGIAPRHIFFMFFAEAFVYAVVGSVVGYILSQGTGKLHKLLFPI